jgi:hypothetical protein
VAAYRVRSLSGDYLGRVEGLAPNLDRGDVVELPTGRDAIVIARVETGEESIIALLEVMVAPGFGSRALGRDARLNPSVRPTD